MYKLQWANKSGYYGGGIALLGSVFQSQKTLTLTFTTTFNIYLNYDNFQSLSLLYCFKILFVTQKRHGFQFELFYVLISFPLSNSSISEYLEQGWQKGLSTHLNFNYKTKLILYRLNFLPKTVVAAFYFVICHKSHSSFIAPLHTYTHRHTHIHIHTDTTSPFLYKKFSTIHAFAKIFGVYH